MAGAHTKVLEVRFHDGRLVGRLVHCGPVYFAYDAGWLATGHNLSPLSLPFTETPFNCKAEGCEGLPGVIADSLPDAWGMKVAQAVFARADWGRPTPVKLLAWIGRGGVGALSFHPPTEPRNEYSGRISAASLAREAKAVMRGDPKAVISTLESAGLAGGAQPKALVMEHADGSLSLAKTPAARGDTPSLLKLSVPGQPANGDAATEHAFGRMTAAAGIRTASSKLIEDEHGTRHLLVKRFDFDARGGRKHMHSLSALLHRPKHGLDYADLFQAIAALPSPDCVAEAARRMVFNLYAGNDDDHGRNHAFLYDEPSHTWQLSPAYDVTFSPATLSRGMTIMGEMRPSWKRLAEWLETTGLSPSTIKNIRDDVLKAISRWKHFADQSGVPQERIKAISNELDAIAEAINSDAHGVVGNAGLPYSFL